MEKKDFIKLLKSTQKSISKQYADKDGAEIGKFYISGYEEWLGTYKVLNYLILEMKKVKGI